MIYTSYFANVKNLPDDLYPIAICGRSPEGWNGPEYKRLAPKWEFFKVWKETHDNDYYIREFGEKVTGKLNADSIVAELMQLCPEGKEPCLICYEKPGDFCHRHLVADWLKDAGYEVTEFEELIYRCSKKGLSLEEIDKWMKES